MPRASTTFTTIRCAARHGVQHRGGCQVRVIADAAQLHRLPNDVVVSDRLLRRLGDQPGTIGRL